MSSEKENPSSMIELYNSTDFNDVFEEIEGENPILYANISQAVKSPLGFLKGNNYFNYIVVSENGLVLVDSKGQNLDPQDIQLIEEYTKEIPNISVDVSQPNTHENLSSKYLVNIFNNSSLIYFPNGLVGLRENDRIYNSFSEYTLNHLLSEQARINREMQYRLEQNTVNMCRIILNNRESIRVRDLPNKKIGVYKRIPGVYLVISDLGLSQCFVQSEKPSPPVRELLLLEKYLHKCFTNNWRDLLLEDSKHHETREGTVQDIIDIVHKHDGLEKVLERGIIQNY